MEEILASIRRIISDEDGAAAPEPQVEPDEEEAAGETAGFCLRCVDMGIVAVDEQLFRIAELATVEFQQSIIVTVKNGGFGQRHGVELSLVGRDNIMQCK